MALRKPNPEAETAATPAGTFEEPEGSTVDNTTEAANEVADEVVDEASPSPAPAPAPAPAAAKSNAVVKRLPTETIWASLQNQIPVDDIADMGIGTFPRITVTEGGYKLDKTTDIGKKIVFEVMSWNLVWLVTTGEQNNPEANKLIRTSYDGVNLKGEGRTIDEYIKHLREVEGYTKAEVKKQAELYGNLVQYQKEDSEGNRKLITVPVSEQKFCQVSLSPQSLAQWQGHLLQAKLRLMKNVQETNVVTMNHQSKTIGPNTFGLAMFVAQVAE